MESTLKLISEGMENMIRLTKLNNDQFVLNSNQIECIEIIPESKVIMANKDFFIVKRKRCDEIIKKSSLIMRRYTITIKILLLLIIKSK